MGNILSNINDDLLWLYKRICKFTYDGGLFKLDKASKISQLTELPNLLKLTYN